MKFEKVLNLSINGFENYLKKLSTEELKQLCLEYHLFFNNKETIAIELIKNNEVTKKK